jgi:hypothetical protein
MIIYNFDFSRPLVGPLKANPPLGVDKHGILPRTVTLEFLEVAFRRKPKVL